MDDTRISDSGNRTSTLVVGLLCGAAIGATLGLLLAPKTGTELRRDIAKGAGKLRRRAAEVYDKTAKAVGRRMEETSEYEAEDGVAVHAHPIGRRSDSAEPIRNVLSDVRRTGNGSESIS